MGGETLVLWQRVVLGAIVAGLFILIGIGMTIFFIIPKLQFGASTEQTRNLSPDEARQNALETYEAIQASVTTTPPTTELNAAIKAAAPESGPSAEERQAALEKYLGSQQ